MDSALPVRDNREMARPGSSRARLAQTLNAAYGSGLISDNTLSHRLDLLFSASVVEPQRLVGDISRRPSTKARILADANQMLLGGLRLIRSALARGGTFEPALLLALDWHGGCEELVIGRHPSCDVVLVAPAVSRRHAALRFRDGHWVLQDLQSRNGTRLNGRRVQRCELRPGDVLGLGGLSIRLD